MLGRCGPTFGMGCVPPRFPEEITHRFPIADSDLGPNEWVGHLHTVAQPQGATVSPLVILVHGLGGTADSGYVRRTAAIAHDLGVFDSESVPSRGGVRRARFLSRGTVSDLLSALDSESLQRFSHRYVLGFSLGGHVVLRLAALHPNAVAAAASICAPLDLAESLRFIDAPSQGVL